MAIKRETKQIRAAAKIALGRKIAIARAANEGKQELVALEAGLKQSELSNVESGKRALSFYGYQRLAKAIGCTLIDFLITEPELKRALGEVARRERNGDINHEGQHQ